MRRTPQVAVQCSWCRKLAPSVTDKGGDAAYSASRAAAVEARWEVQKDGSILCRHCAKKAASMSTETELALG